MINWIHRNRTFNLFWGGAYLYEKESLYRRKKFYIFQQYVSDLASFDLYRAFLNIIATSFASTQEVVAKKFILFPTTFSLDAYRYILSTPTIFRALAVSIGVTGVGTIVSMCATSLMAYGLSRKYLFGRGFVNFLVVFFYVVQRGMIPTFLVVRSLGLVNSYWAMILPVAVNAMNMIIMRNFFQALPDSLEESAKWMVAQILVYFSKSCYH